MQRAGLAGGSRRAWGDRRLRSSGRPPRPPRPPSPPPITRAPPLPPSSLGLPDAAEGDRPHVACLHARAHAHTPLYTRVPAGTILGTILVTGHVPFVPSLPFSQHDDRVAGLRGLRQGLRDAPRTPPGGLSGAGRDLRARHALRPSPLRPSAPCLGPSPPPRAPLRARLPGRPELQGQRGRRGGRAPLGEPARPGTPRPRRPRHCRGWRPGTAQRRPPFGGGAVRPRGAPSPSTPWRSHSPIRGESATERDRRRAAPRRSAGGGGPGAAPAPAASGGRRSWPPPTTEGRAAGRGPCGRRT